MALDFLGLVTEVYARGFQMYSSAAGLTRVKRWINDAMHEVDRKERWPYTVAVTTTTLGTNLLGLHHVDSVVDLARDQALTFVPHATLVDTYADLSTVGTPEYWYLGGTTGGGVPRVGCYPAAPTVSFAITHYSTLPDLVIDPDVPLMPDEYRYIIVELACRQAYRDSENFEAAADCLAAAEIILGEMREDLLDAPRFVARTLSAADD